MEKKKKQSFFKRTWKKIVNSYAGRGNCQAGKNESMRKVMENNSGKKPGRKRG